MFVQCSINVIVTGYVQHACSLGPSMAGEALTGSWSFLSAVLASV